METNLPSPSVFIDRIMKLRAAYAESLRQHRAAVKQVYDNAADAGIERDALGIAVAAVERRAKAEASKSLKKLDANAVVANGYLAEFYNGAK